MATPAPDDDRAAAQAHGVLALQRRLSELTRIADTATRSYDRLAWLRYAVIFVPVPFAVVVFRLHMQAWHYYAAGGLFMALALAVYWLDAAAAERRDKALQAAQDARDACEAAQV